MQHLAPHLEPFAQEPEDQKIEGRDDEREEDHDRDAWYGIAQVVAADVLAWRFDQDAIVRLQVAARSQQGIGKYW